MNNLASVFPHSASSGHYRKSGEYHCQHLHHRHQSNVADLIEGNPQYGIGDPYFPEMGNPGYDALHYDLKLKVNPGKDLEASVKMQAKALADQDTVNLDFRGFDISKVSVNGKPVEYKRDKNELILDSHITAGQDFEVQVDYAGTPQPFNSPHAPIPIGWNNIKEGSYVLSEPDGASTWMPCNDHPRDKATYDFEITVPEGFSAIANGNLVSKQTQDHQSTYHWKADEPMASYLSTVTVGKYREEHQTGPNGLPIVNFFPEKIADTAVRDFSRVPEMISWFSERFGDYPFNTYGNIVIPQSVGGAALETQTRPIYERGMVDGFKFNEYIYAHELAHQWFGDSVSVHNWKDIWLNEGFACYCHNMWRYEHSGGFAKLDKAMKRVYDGLPRSQPPVKDPGEEGLFASNVYDRGAVALHELRKTLGDQDFFKAVTAYTSKFKGQNAGTEDFIQIVNATTGKDMTAQINSWVAQSELPAWK